MIYNFLTFCNIGGQNLYLTNGLVHKRKENYSFVRGDGRLAVAARTINVRIGNTRRRTFDEFRSRRRRCHTYALHG